MSTSSVHISSIDRIPAVVTLTATNPDGSPATIGTVNVVALPHRNLPAADTTWISATFSSGQAPVTLTGPAATPQAGDLVIAENGSDVWAKDSAADHTQAVKVGFVYID